jgi:hypothetical protein
MKRAEQQSAFFIYIVVFVSELFYITVRYTK